MHAEGLIPFSARIIMEILALDNALSDIDIETT
jgi:hypothetical protein